MGSPHAVPSDRADIIVDIFGARADAARAYVDLLATTGITHGLVGPREADRLWERHVLNCAVVQDRLPRGCTVLDVGSGAGLPGLVLAIARPDLAVTLVEPLARRVAWLTTTIDELDLDNVDVVRGRAQDLHGRLRAPVVTARAVAPIGRLALWCLPLVAPGGVLLAFKGDNARIELERDADQILRAGGGSVAVRHYGLGVLDPPTTVAEIEVPRSGRSGTGSRALPG